ncbi:Glyoxalase domain-containing protein 4, partial [Fragariocoptes setiger]
MVIRRALHYVLKVANLADNVKFFRDQLGMTVLRHEVFDSGCEAACNGPYDNKWSKTMIGYGPEDDYFVLELTYNYSVGKYNLGNDINYLKIKAAADLFNKIKESEREESQESDETLELVSPDGYKFIVEQLEEGKKTDVTQVCLSCIDLNKSKNYWINLLKCELYSESERELVFGYSDKQTSLKLIKIDSELNHATAYGRIAFSCPASELKSIEALVADNKHTILTPYISLDTPGKASVEVVILADPDGHEICFVGDEGFRELSKVDPDANKLIDQSIADDKSAEWFAKKKKFKKDAS